MLAALWLADKIDGLGRGIGYLAILCLPVIVLLGGSVVVLRYGFQLGFPWLSESFVWLNGLVITLGASYLMIENKHVRVDVLYTRLSERGRAVVTVFGVLFLLWPAMYVIGTASWNAVLRSVFSLEMSPSIDGLPFMYVMKAAVPAFCVLVSLQGLSDLIRAVHLLGNSGGEGARDHG
ncbi:MAG: TRAP transporter small permease subunit [Alphaproteobacteria bacterium]